MIAIPFLTIWLFGGLKVIGVSLDQTVISNLIYWIYEAFSLIQRKIVIRFKLPDWIT